MKKLIVLTLSIVLYNIAFTQDLIITNQGDTIFCEIISAGKNEINFKQEKNDEFLYNEIEQTDVKGYLFNYLDLHDLIITKQQDSIYCKILNLFYDRIEYRFKNNGTLINTEISFEEVNKYSFNNYETIIFNEQSKDLPDLLVTTKGDSINCKIISILSKKIKFRIFKSTTAFKFQIPVNEVSNYKLNHYKIAQIAKPYTKLDSSSIKAQKNTKENLDNTKYTNTNLSFYGGFSHRIAKLPNNIPNALKDYVQKLKSGYHFGGKLTYFFNETSGIGIIGNIFKSSNEIDNVFIYNSPGNFGYGKVSDDITISFIAPCFSKRFTNRSNGNTFITNYAIGYMGYSNNAIVIDKFHYKGNTVGFSANMGLEINLDQGIALGFKLSVLSGVLKMLELQNQTIELRENEYENLSRIDFSIGLIMQ